MRDALYADWARQLRSHRIEAGLSQTALADAAGSTKAHISNIERGITGVSDMLRMRLAAALGTTAAELFPYPDADRAGVA
jgi:transcriptional regulator with XRE-family HTH domain